MQSTSDMIDDEMRSVIAALYATAARKDSELATLRQERSSIRSLLRRLVVLIFAGIKKFGRVLFRFIGTSSDKTVQTKVNAIPTRTTYVVARERKRTIAHFIPTLVTGGSQQLVVDLMENIADYDHVVVTGRSTGSIGYLGIPNHLIPLKERSDQTDLLKFMNRFKPDLFHVHFWATIDNMTDWKWYEHIFLHGLANDLPVVQNCNNPTFPYFDSKIARNIYVSRYAEKVFGLNAPGNQVIYPGSNFQKFKRSFPYQPTDTIGMVYRLELDKLNAVSIEPFIQVVKNHPRTKVIIVGGGTWYDLYRSRVVEEHLSENFEFTGYVAYDELPKYYSKLGLFAAPVYQESFGQVTPFAMNMGIPVVGYNVGALPEIIDDSTLLAPNQNVAALSQIICELLDNPERMLEIGRRNQQRAQALFSLDSMISEYKKLYDEVLVER